MAEAETFETMQPNPVWDAASYPNVVDAPAAADYTFKVWGGDRYDSCRGQLPDSVAALDAAGVPAERIDHYPAEKANNGSKVGPLIEEYDVKLIPAIVVEHDGKEVARFVEEEDVPIAVCLANKLSN